MKRTVNHTGKIRIEQRHFSAKPLVRGIQKDIELSWDFTGTSFNPNDEVVVEIDALGSNVRRVLGRVESVTGSAVLPFSNDVTELGAKLTLMTVKSSEKKRTITGKSAALPILFSKTDQDKRSLLRVQLVDDLRKLWNLDYHAGAPVLQISNKNSSYSKLSSKKAFLYSVLPEVIGEITLHCLLNTDTINPDVRDKWLKFLKVYGLDDVTVQDFENSSHDDLFSNLQNAITKSKSVSEEFSARHRFVETVIKELENGDD